MFVQLIINPSDPGDFLDFNVLWLFPVLPLWLSQHNILLILHISLL